MDSNARIAKIVEADLGPEDHGIFTAHITLDYGDSGQGVAGYDLRGPQCSAFIRAVMSAAGVNRWSKVEGRTVLALFDDETKSGLVRGLAPLPTEPGGRVWFPDLFAEAGGNA